MGSCLPQRTLDHPLALPRTHHDLSSFSFPYPLLPKVKHFFLAIYNVSVVGGAMYFFSLYGSSSAGSFVILRCVGIFVSATLPVLIIMVPKFTVIQYKNITGKNLWAASKNIADIISSNSKSKDSHVEIASVQMKEVLKRQHSSTPKVLPGGEGYEADQPDVAGVGSSKTFFSSGSRKQSAKVLQNSFNCADRIANEMLRTGNASFKSAVDEDSSNGEGHSKAI